jgi:ribosomal protein L17
MKLAKRRRIGRRIQPQIDKNQAKSLLKYKSIVTTFESGKRSERLVNRLVRYINKEDKRSFLKYVGDRGLYRELSSLSFEKNGGNVSRRRMANRKGDGAELVRLTLIYKESNKEKEKQVEKQVN